MIPSQPAPSYSVNHRSASAKSLVTGVRCQGNSEPGEQLLEPLTTFGPGRGPQVLPTDGEQIEGHQLGRDLLESISIREAAGWIRKLELVELGDVVDDHDDLAVDHRPGRELLERREQLREVPQQRLAVAALQLGFVPAPGDGAEAIPLGFIDPTFSLRRGLRTFAFMGLIGEANGHAVMRPTLPGGPTPHYLL